MSNNAASDSEVQLQASTANHSAVAKQDACGPLEGPQGAGARRQPPVLYLSFEGVLHAEHYGWSTARQRYLRSTLEEKLFVHADLLCDLLRPYPDIRIVLSAGWVSEFGFAVSVAQLPLQLQNRVVGHTEHAVSLFPGQQVAADALKRKPASWLALEVDLFGWPEWCLPHVVVCDPDLGISRHDVGADLEARLAEIGRRSG
jgi:hypothetical protein